MSGEEFMQQAIDKTKDGISKGQSPFGAVVVKDGKVVSSEHNTVWLTTDPTAHAEVNAIRAAAKALKSIDLSGTVMYTTCEPCPMCLSAIHWSKIDIVYYGATIADADSAGFSEITFDAKRLASEGGSPLKVELGPLRKECCGLFTLWKDTDLCQAY